MLIFMVNFSVSAESISIRAEVARLFCLVKDVIGFMLPILMLADVLAVGAHWTKWNGRLLVWLIPASLAGVTVGTLFLANAPSEQIRTMLGVIVLLLALYKLFEERISRTLKYSPRI